MSGERWPPQGGDSRCLVVGCGGVEGTNERAAIGVADRRLIEKLDAANRSLDLRESPLAPRRIGEVDASEITTRVIARDDLVCWAHPSIVALVVAERERRRDVAPPIRHARELDRIQLDDVPLGALTCPRDRELDRGQGIQGRQRETRRIELDSQKRIGCTAGAAAERRKGRENRIARLVEVLSTGRDELPRLRAADHVRD